MPRHQIQREHLGAVLTADPEHDVLGALFLPRRRPRGPAARLRRGPRSREDSVAAPDAAAVADRFVVARRRRWRRRLVLLGGWYPNSSVGSSTTAAAVSGQRPAVSSINWSTTSVSLPRRRSARRWRADDVPASSARCARSLIIAQSPRRLELRPQQVTSSLTHLGGGSAARAGDVDEFALEAGPRRAPERGAAQRREHLAGRRHRSAARRSRVRRGRGTVRRSARWCRPMGSCRTPAAPGSAPDSTGRTSKYTIPASAITPLSTRSATSWSYSAAEDTGAARPVVGQRCHTSVRPLE